MSQCLFKGELAVFLQSSKVAWVEIFGQNQNPKTVAFPELFPSMATSQFCYGVKYREWRAQICLVFL